VRIDDTNWDPLSVDYLAAIFRGSSVPWWIAGGWALELYVDWCRSSRATHSSGAPRQSPSPAAPAPARHHHDIDLLVLRRDQLIVRERLEPDWQLFRTKSPGLAPWPPRTLLAPPVNDVWVRRDDDAGWAFQIMLMDTEGDEWVYRRLPSIRGKIADLGLCTGAGIPYLRPEIQLLYKGRAEFLDRDLDDLKRVIPHLPSDKLAWLLDCLRLQYPCGHEWIAYIESVHAQE
jgi:hypothetical protein